MDAPDPAWSRPDQSTVRAGQANPAGRSSVKMAEDAVQESMQPLPAGGLPAALCELEVLVDEKPSKGCTCLLGVPDVERERDAESEDRYVDGAQQPAGKTETAADEIDFVTADRDERLARQTRCSLGPRRCSTSGTSVPRLVLPEREQDRDWKPVPARPGSRSRP